MEKSFYFIQQKPLLGWGAATFPILYFLKDGIINARHTHSMPLEIAQMYGIPLAVILTFFLLDFYFSNLGELFLMIKKFIILVSIKLGYLSTLIILISHLTDITYYDGKISLLIWIYYVG